jgi:hypothetical protein
MGFKFTTIFAPISDEDDDQFRAASHLTHKTINIYLV